MQILYYIWFSVKVWSKNYIILGRERYWIWTWSSFSKNIQQIRIYESVSFILTVILSLVHGFHIVIVTRSYTRTEKMSVLQDLHDYFSELIHPLANSICLEQMFQKLKEGIIIKFEGRFIEQNRKIDELG